MERPRRLAHGDPRRLATLTTVHLRTESTHLGSRGTLTLQHWGFSVPLTRVAFGSRHGGNLSTSPDFAPRVVPSGRYCVRD